MQILPDNFTERTPAAPVAYDDAVSSRLPSSPSQSQFEEELRKSFQANNSNSYADAQDSTTDSAASDPAANDYFNAFLASSPYNPNPEAFSPFAPQKVRLTSTEADKLIEAMGQDNISPLALAAMKDMSRLPGGATAEQLIQAAREAIMGKGSKLSSVDEAQLLSLSQKSAGAQGKELKNLFTQGTPQQALESFLGGLGADESITVSKDEMSALIKSLGLNENTGKNLLAAFGDKNTITTTGKGMAALLDIARKELDMAAREQEKLLGSLEKRLPSIMRDAEKREEMERMAGMREDRAVAQARTLIQDKASQAAPGRDDVADQDKQTRASASNKQDGGKDDISKDIIGKDTLNKAASAESVAQTDKNTKADAQHADTNTLDAKALQAREDRQSENKGDSKSGFGKFSDSDTRNGRAAQTQATTSTSSLYATATQGVDTVPASSTQMPTATTQTTPQAPMLSPKALEQIENAFLTSSKNGTQRLEIALSPSDLGSLTVVLTSRHGEISALIKPDRAETAAMLTQQAEQIRQELEHQGFKVEKVDVQTQLSDQGGQNWQGADQHNSSRDLASRADEMMRLRRLGRSSADISDLDSALARDMHLQARSASVAGQGMHLIA